MAHAAPLPPGHQRRRLLTIIAAIVIVIVVAVGAVLFFGGGSDGKKSAAPTTSAAGPTPSPSLTTSASSTPAPSPTPTPTPTRTTPKTTATPKPTPTPSKTVSPLTVPLLILNNTNITGLAGGASAEFQGKGWTVTSIGQFDGNILSSVAYYDPSAAINQAAATLLQSQFPGIKRVVPRFDGLPAGPVVVVLTSDYS